MWFTSKHLKSCSRLRSFFPLPPPPCLIGWYPVRPINSTFKVNCMTWPIERLQLGWGYYPAAVHARTYELSTSSPALTHRRRSIKAPVMTQSWFDYWAERSIGFRPIESTKPSYNTTRGVFKSRLHIWNCGLPDNEKHFTASFMVLLTFKGLTKILL